ncbi:MAG: carboxypeptidase M32 [Clostridiales bacterium]|nr:carboxypeptidase M32 [Clostridiales bacterium]
MTDISALKERLYEIQSLQSAYDHALSLISYDGVTSAPAGTAQNRGHAVSLLSGEKYKLSTSEETVKALEELDQNRDQLSGREQRMVFLMLKEIRQMRKIPMDEYIAYEELLVQADDIWHTAKENSDFALFEPCLEKIFATNIRFASLIAPDKDPYDYWLGEFEDGLDMKTCDAFFATLRARLVPLIRKIGEKPQVDDACLKGDFSDADQEKLAKELMKIMGLDLDHVGLATTEHPFTTDFGSHLDERITTHYQRDDFSSSLFSVIHEGGHALYDTGSDESLCYTVLDGGVSMGIHESQSRFYENILGRSRAFSGFLAPVIRSCLKDRAAYSDEDFYKALNKVQPSLIRTEADEVTYCLHVMVRYELEKALMHGQITVHDLPGEWNRLYKEYLGVDVPDDRHGVLQDSHWSGGAIGYFPSYALGSAYGAQFLKKMKETVDVDACLAKGDFDPVNAWNREHIWKWGSEKPADRLLKDVLGEPFDPSVYLDYLAEKRSDVYGI